MLQNALFDFKTGFRVSHGRSITSQNIEARLLSPSITINSNSCITYTLSLIGEGPVGVKIEDYLLDRDLLWGQWFFAREIREIQFPILLFSGAHRFTLSVAMTTSGEVLLKKAEWTDPEVCKSE